MLEKLKNNKTLINISEKLKDKKILIMYLLGVLILSTGVSYAYFTTAINQNGTGQSDTISLTSMASARVDTEANIEFSNDGIYPGHTEITSMTVIGVMQVTWI